MSLTSKPINEKIVTLRHQILSAEKSIELMRSDFRRYIRQAKQEGHTEQEISDWLGVTKQRVHQLQ